MKNRTYKELSEFKKRRDQVCANHKNCAFVLFSGSEPMWERFRADSNFVYLTGFEEPESMMVLLPGEDKPFHMFVRERDPAKEIWDGYRYGLEGVKSVFGADHSYKIESFAEIFPTLLQNVDRVYYSIQGDESDYLVLRAIKKYISTLGRSGRGMLPIHDPKDVIGEMRLIKSEQEIAWMKESCELSAKAHVEAMKTIRPGMNEKDIQAILFKEFYSQGAFREGYFSIVAAGPNATILHYRDNNDKCRDGDLLLIDAGAEKHYYTADITRTFPINGKFTEAQKDIYSRVLKVQKQLVEFVKPGIRYEDIQEKARTLLTEELLDLGFLKGTVEENLKSGTYRKYYPHNIGHFIGMDVHDVGQYRVKGQSRTIEANMALTIEPGLYIPVNDDVAPQEYRGIGVRIEDDIVVTKDGRQVLTSGVTKEVAEIEALVGSGPELKQL